MMCSLAICVSGFLRLDYLPDVMLVARELAFAEDCKDTITNLLLTIKTH